MKDRISIQRDMAIANIKDSKNFSEEEKIHLATLVSDAAEGTNGLDEKDKLQNVSETTFNLAVLMTRLEDKTNKINDNVEKLADKMASFKTSVIPQTWTDCAKAILMKPWPYVCLAIAVFSPYCVDIINQVKSFVK